jgi:hypothetical protein
MFHKQEEHNSFEKALSRAAECRSPSPVPDFEAVVVGKVGATTLVRLL